MAGRPLRRARIARNNGPGVDFKVDAEDPNLSNRISIYANTSVYTDSQEWIPAHAQKLQPNGIFVLKISLFDLDTASREMLEYYGTDANIVKRLEDFGFERINIRSGFHRGEHTKNISVQVAPPISPKENDSQDVFERLSGQTGVGAAKAIRRELDSIVGSVTEIIREAYAAARSSKRTGKPISSKFAVVLTYKGIVLEVVPVDTQKEVIDTFQAVQADIRIKIVEGSVQKGSRANPRFR